MKRITCEPRKDWQRKVEELGFMFHTTKEGPYWNESAYYEFTSEQIDAIDIATNRLNEMCILAVDYIINNNLLHQFGIDEKFHDLIRTSWDRDEITIIGRFDLAYDGTGEPKLLEYNADTPTSLLEAAVIQHKWVTEVHPTRDQFNTIHERLIEAWQRVKEDYGASRVLFASLNSWEDLMNTTYLRDTATQAGLITEFNYVKEIGWDSSREEFVDISNRVISHCFKLYPWEMMIAEDFGKYLTKSETRWLEPAWKMLLSNKALLAVLWRLFPDNPYLLEASFEPFSSGPYVKKPFLSREGANVELEDNDGAIFKTEGVYGGPYVYQRFHPLAVRDGYHAVIGSWMVNGWACGIGVREDESPITGNLSKFVPHLF